MKSSLLLALTLAVSTPVLATEPSDDVRPELELKRLLFAKSAHELSGLAATQPGSTDLLTVADEAEDHFIYRIKYSDGGKRYRLEPTIDLTKLKGYDVYVKSLKDETRVAEKDRRLDFEGLAVCGTTIYAINERVRQVLVIDKTSLTRAPINFSGYEDLFAGEANAGFEGIAADCESGLLFVAKEREPRRIFTIEIKTWTLIGDYDVTQSERSGQKVINPWTGNGLLTLSPDFADLTFDGGFLYALERNTYEIAKIDPKAFTVVARVSYLKAEKGLYETGEPFGIAEGLSLTKDEIVIGLDHNGSPISGTAAKRTGIKGDFGSILVFKRPAGF